MDIIYGTILTYRKIGESAIKSEAFEDGNHGERAIAFYEQEVKGKEDWHVFTPFSYPQVQV